MKAAKGTVDTVNFELFDRVINGNMRPHLPNFDSQKKIEKLFKEARSVKKGIFPGDISFFENLDLTTHGFREGDKVKLEITHDEKKGEVKAYLTNVSDEGLEPLFDIDIPPPPDLKSEYFLFLIEREYDIQIARTEIFFKNCNNQEQLKFFADKKIQLLKRLASQAHIYQKKLHKENIDDWHNPDAYVIDVLKEFILRTILEIQDMFKPFLSLKYQSENELKIELFEYAKDLALIHKLKSLFGKKDEKKNTIKKFDDLPEKNATFILSMLEDLSITKDGQSILGPKDINIIRVIVEAASEKSILPPNRIHFFCQLIGEKINQPIKSKLSRPKFFEATKKRFTSYISSHPLQ